MMENNEINPYAIQTIASSGKWMRNIAVTILILLGIAFLTAVLKVKRFQFMFEDEPIISVALICSIALVVYICVLTLKTGNLAMQLELKPNNQAMEKYLNSYLILQYILMGIAILTFIAGTGGLLNDF